MADLTVVPTRVEWGTAREQYEALVADLRREAYNVSLQEPPVEERRGGPIPEPSVVSDVAIFLGEHVADAAVAAIMATAVTATFEAD